MKSIVVVFACVIGVSLWVAAADSELVPPAPKASPEMTVALFPVAGAQPDVEILLFNIARELDGTEGFTVLERSRIDLLMKEHELNVESFSKNPVAQGKLVGADYFILVNYGGPDTSRRYSLTAVEVRTGNVFSEDISTIDSADSKDVFINAGATIAKQLAELIQKNERERTAPSGVVLNVENKSVSSRLNRLQDLFTELAEKALQSKGYRVLGRRLPLLLSDETALGASGLVHPDRAVLAETADVALNLYFTETPSVDTAFTNTPIHLQMILVKKAQASRQTNRLDFTIASMDNLAERMAALIPAPDGARTDDKALEDIGRKIEAARMMTELKDLEFVSSPEDHRKQVTLASRIIYLDPTAKEAYYRLGISFDALVRQAHEGSSSDTAKAFRQYLSFPWTDNKKVRSAFQYGMEHIYYGKVFDAMKDYPTNDMRAAWVFSMKLRELPKPRSACMPLIADSIRWQRQCLPDELPEVIIPTNYELQWPIDDQIAFYEWVDMLYDNKKHLSVVPDKLAFFYDSAGSRQKAAEFLYEAVVAYGFDDIRLNSHIGDWKWYYESGHPEDLAQLLDRPRRDRLLARLQSHKNQNNNPEFRQLFGNTFGPVDSLYGFSYRADQIRLEATYAKSIAPVPVDLPVGLPATCFVRKMGDELWLQGVTEKGRFVLLRRKNNGVWEEQHILVRNHVNDTITGDIVLAGTTDTSFFFASDLDAVYQFHSVTGGWTRYGRDEGLLWGNFDTLFTDADGKGIWVYDFGHLARILNGSLQMDNAPRIIRDATDDLIERSVYDPLTGKEILTLGKSNMWETPGLPSFFYPLSRYPNRPTPGLRRLAKSRDGFVQAANSNLIIYDGKGNRKQGWRPSAFRHWGEIGGWIEGNCPLPPCCIVEVIPDDLRPDLMWIISKKGSLIGTQMTLRGQAEMMKDGGLAALKARPSDETPFYFVTALDTSSNLFSQPVRITEYLATLEPFGEDVFIAGSGFGRLPKTMWPTDQKADPNTPPVMSGPDYPLHECAKALLAKDFDAAMTCLVEFQRKHPNSQTIKRMCSELQSLK